jgi:hypothetical protein
MKKSVFLDRHSRPVEDQPFFHGGYPEVLKFPGFRVALGIASLPGMTADIFNELQFQDARFRVPVSDVSVPNLEPGTFNRV